MKVLAEQEASALLAKTTKDFRDKIFLQRKHFTQQQSIQAEQHGADLDEVRKLIASSGATLTSPGMEGTKARIKDLFVVWHGENEIYVGYVCSQIDRMQAQCRQLKNKYEPGGHSGPVRQHVRAADSPDEQGVTGRTN